MRELKFRAWDSFAKKFKYGSRVVDHYTNCELYTGLKDKNGKEIYEGDIVNMPSSECAVVDYDAGSFTLNCSHCSATWTMDRWCFELGLHLDNICTTVEVIGNVHENKELLK